MFSNPTEVVRALRRLKDSYDPRTTSLMALGAPFDPHAEPFRSGFITHLEERKELLRRLAELDPREQQLIVLWHVEGHPVAQIARRIGISRVHAYRVQRRAIASMLDEGREAVYDEAAAVPV